MKSYKYGLLLSTIAIALLAAVACSGASQSSSTGSQVMEKKDVDAAMDKEDGTMEKKDGAVMDKKDDSMMKLPDLIKAAHFVDSSPTHGDATAQVPEKIMINFNFTLHEVSSIAVTRDAKPVETGKVVLTTNGLSMSTNIPKPAGNGLYVVAYKACWPDRSCHDGQFGFVVDDMKKMSYQDMTGKNEVLVSMKDIKFRPSHLIVSKGTKVVWKNQEATLHFLNSDPHPSHNVLPSLNSLVIKMGEDYSYTFTEAGEWGFHCSAHYPDGMSGRIIVV